VKLAFFHDVIKQSCSPTRSELRGWAGFGNPRRFENGGIGHCLDSRLATCLLFRGPRSLCSHCGFLGMGYGPVRSGVARPLFR
jgi:hypothetical protein